MVTQITPINLIPGQMIPRVNISQYDTGARVLKFSVYNGEAPFTFTNAMTVALVGTKPDGKGFSYAGTIVSNMPTFDVTAQMSAVAGKVRSELVVFENGKRVGSGNFVIFVEECALGEGTDMSDSDYAIINDALEASFDLDHFYADLQSMVTEAVEDIQVVQGQTVIDPTLTISGAAADAKATGDMARNFLEALMTETTTEANIASIDDGAGGLPLKQFVGNIQPTQAGSGDPAPDNVRAISGYTAVNVYRAGGDLLTGVTYRNGYYDNTGAFVSSVNTKCTNEYTPCTGGAGYAIRFVYGNTNTSSRVRVHEYDAGQSWLRQAANVSTTKSDDAITITWTASSDAKYFRFSLPLFAEIECFGDAETYAVNFPTLAGTVYGGTLLVNSDGSGALMVDTAGWTFDGTETPSNIGTLTNYYRARYNTANLAGTSIADGVTKYSHGIIDNTYAGEFSHAYGTPSYVYAFVPIVEGQTVKQYMAAQYTANTPVQVTYKLANPTTYALSAVQVAQMLQGVNNVWMDAAGMVQATYYANTALYVDKKIAELQAMVLENQ